LKRLDWLEEAPTLFVRNKVILQDQPGPVIAYFYQGDVTGFPDCGESWPSKR